MTITPKLDALDPVALEAAEAKAPVDHKASVPAIVAAYLAALPAKDAGLVERLELASARFKNYAEVPSGVYTVPGVVDRLAVSRDDVLMAQYRLAEAAAALSLPDVGGEPRGEAVAWRALLEQVKRDYASALETIVRLQGGDPRALTEWQRWTPQAHTLAMIDKALADATPPAQPAREVAVKPLEWSDECDASTPFGTYTVRDAEGGVDGYQWTFHTYPFAIADDIVHPNVSAAIAAAQADYETRIRSALASPHPKGETL